MIQINLDEILEVENKKAFYNDGFVNYFTAAQQSIIRKAMLEFGKQLLELAVWNAEVIERTGRDANPECFVSSDSIINTINQVI